LTYSSREEGRETEVGETCFSVFVNENIILRNFNRRSEPPQMRTHTAYVPMDNVLRMDYPISVLDDSRNNDGIYQAYDIEAHELRP
jgi:hypothetical protein